MHFVCEIIIVTDGVQMMNSQKIDVKPALKEQTTIRMNSKFRNYFLAALNAAAAAIAFTGSKTV